jgi:hypothetical protein
MFLQSNDNDYNARIDPFYYNCGGFAFRNYEWFWPYDTSEWDGIRQLKYVMGIEEATIECTEFMLKNLPGLRLIDKEEDATKNENVVFFRISEAYDDFHFIRKEDGRYLHKMGCSSEICEMSKEEVYSNGWCRHKYDGPIVIFGYDKSQETEIAI